MSNQSPETTTFEQRIDAWNGWAILVINIVVLVAALVFGLWTASGDGSGGGIIARVPGALLGVAGILLMFGYFTLQPNEARVLILFGDYRGTVRKSGFHWANPFYARSRGNAPPKAGTPAE